MVFTLPALSYGYEALEPFVDSTTMSIHHTKHHQASPTTRSVKILVDLEYLDGRDIGIKRFIIVSLTQTYITNVNNALEKFPELADLGIGT